MVNFFSCRSYFANGCLRRVLENQTQNIFKAVDAGYHLGSGIWLVVTLFGGGQYKRLARQKFIVEKLWRVRQTLASYPSRLNISTLLPSEVAV